MADHFEHVDGKPARVRDGVVNLGLAVDVERQGRLANADGPGDPRCRLASASTQFLAAYDALVEKARTNTLTADDLVGANLTLTNPGGLGTTASVPRLMTGQGTIVATGSIAFPPGLAEIGERIGAEKVMTLTSTYDHRVIQGAESGRFLGARRGAARRRGRLLRGRLRAPSASRSRRCRSAARPAPATARRRRAAGPRRARSCSRPRRPRTRSCARCARTAISPRRSTRSARRRRATPRSTRRRSG